MKNKLKSSAKTMVFVSPREKSDKSRSTLLSVYSCCKSEFELSIFNKINASVSISTSIIGILLLLFLKKSVFEKR